MIFLSLEGEHYRDSAVIRNYPPDVGQFVDHVNQSVDMSRNLSDVATALGSVMPVVSAHFPKRPSCQNCAFECADTMGFNQTGQTSRHFLPSHAIHGPPERIRAPIDIVVVCIWESRVGGVYLVVAGEQPR